MKAIGERDGAREGTVGPSESIDGRSVVAVAGNIGQPRAAGLVETVVRHEAGLAAAELAVHGIANVIRGADHVPDAHLFHLSIKVAPAVIAAQAERIAVGLQRERRAAKSLRDAVDVQHACAVAVDRRRVIPAAGLEV